MLNRPAGRERSPRIKSVIRLLKSLKIDIFHWDKTPQRPPIVGRQDPNIASDIYAELTSNPNGVILVIRYYNFTRRVRIVGTYTDFFVSIHDIDLAWMDIKHLYFETSSGIVLMGQLVNLQFVPDTLLPYKNIPLPR